MNKTVKNQPDIFSLILSVYGSLENSVKFCTDNNFVFNSPDIIPGMNVAYTPSLVVTPSPVQVLPASAPAPAAVLSFKSRYGQSLFDVAINTYGSLDNYIKMLVDNNCDNTLIPSGEAFKFTTSLINDVNLYNETTAKGVYFSTGTYNAPVANGGDFNSDFSDDFSGG